MISSSVYINPKNTDTSIRDLFITQEYFCKKPDGTPGKLSKTKYKYEIWNTVNKKLVSTSPTFESGGQCR